MKPFCLLTVSFASLQVDLQQMELSCDPEKAYSEGCCELSGVVSPFPFDIVLLLSSKVSMCVCSYQTLTFFSHGSVEAMQRLV